MSDYIPNEILIEILAKLPVVSLLRFTSVCKSWYSLITSPSFVAKHLNHSKTNSDKLLIGLFCVIEKRAQYLLCRDDGNFGDEYSELDFPRGYWVVGSCNGLLCLCDNDDNDGTNIVVWNPSIRKSVALPRIDYPQGPPRLVLGFAAHPTTHEFMVVSIVHTLVLPDQERVPSKVGVYTQGGGSWRAICSASPPFNDVLLHRHAIVVDGILHWRAYNSVVVSGSCSVIVTFNTVTEAFSEMLLPSVLTNRRGIRLSVIGESLAVICRGQMGRDTWCVWVMKEYGVPESWTKLFSTTLTGETIECIFGFRRNGEVLLATDNADNCLLSYVYGTKTKTDTRIRGAYPFYADTYIETLVLMEGQNDILRGAA